MPERSERTSYRRCDAVTYSVLFWLHCFGSERCLGSGRWSGAFHRSGVGCAMGHWSGLLWIQLVGKSWAMGVSIARTLKTWQSRQVTVENYHSTEGSANTISGIRDCQRRLVMPLATGIGHRQGCVFRQVESAKNPCSQHWW
jgi:hypothetical protein